MDAHVAKIAAALAARNAWDAVTSLRDALAEIALADGVTDEESEFMHAIQSLNAILGD